MTTGGRDPERVAAGGVDDRGPGLGPDREVVRVGVVVHQDRGDRLRLGLARPGVRGDYLVAGLELANRDSSARSEQNLGGCG